MGLDFETSENRILIFEPGLEFLILPDNFLMTNSICGSPACLYFPLMQKDVSLSEKKKYELKPLSPCISVLLALFQLSSSFELL